MIAGSWTYYRDAFIYSKPNGGGEQLDQILHPEGFIKRSGANYVYHYFVTDHAGNVRAVLQATGAGTQPVRVQKTDYYPYGLAHQYDNVNLNKYIHSGKELQAFALAGAAWGGTGTLNLFDFGSRHYNPVLGRWANIDPALQFANPYLYAANNPVMYTDPDGEFVFLIPQIGWSKNGGFHIGISLMVGIPGVASAQVGAGYSFKNNDASAYMGVTAMFNTASISYSSSSGLNTGWSAGLSPCMGFPVSTNFTSAGVNYNISNNRWSGNVSAWNVDNNGWSFDPSFSAMVYPQHTTNLFRGQGFRSNNSVLNRFVANGQYQGALDYFGFKGTYDPNYDTFQKHGGQGTIDQITGDIFYNTSAFMDGYDNLNLTADHELRHSRNVLSGKYKGMDITNEVVYQEEYNTYRYNYKRQGLYPGTSGDISFEINQNGFRLGLNPETMIYPYVYHQNRPAWHSIYKIPRLW